MCAVAPPGGGGTGNPRRGPEGRGPRVASSGTRGTGHTAPRGAAAWAPRPIRAPHAVAVMGPARATARPCQGPPRQARPGSRDHPRLYLSHWGICLVLYLVVLVGRWRGPIPIREIGPPQRFPPDLGRRATTGGGTVVAGK